MKRKVMDEMAASPVGGELPVSRRTLRMIDDSAAHFRDGVASPPIDPEPIRRLAKRSSEGSNKEP